MHRHVDKQMRPYHLALVVIFSACAAMLGALMWVMGEGLAP